MREQSGPADKPVQGLELTASSTMGELEQNNDTDMSGSESLRIAPSSPAAQRECGCSYRCMQWAARALFAVVLALILAAAGVIIWQIVVQHAENHIVAWFVGGIFTLLCVVISTYDITQHWLHWHDEKQIYYVRILGMVVIYAVESWSALRFRHSAIYLETLRDAYESYVIYCFFQLLLLSIGNEQTVIRRLKEVGFKRAQAGTGTTAGAPDGYQAMGQERAPPSPQGGADAAEGGVAVPPSSFVAPPSQVSEETAYFARHMVPFCCLPRWRLGSPFLHYCRVGVFQYVVLKLVTAAATLITTVNGTYGNGEFTNFNVAFPYISIIVNCSQMWAIYCLVLFYHEMLPHLNTLGISPVGKLLLIKGIVFLTWWQGIALSGLTTLGLIQPTLTYSADEVADGLQNFAITVEMLFFAIGHHFLFHWSDCAPVQSPAGAHRPRRTSLLGAPSRANAGIRSTNGSPETGRRALLTPAYDRSAFPPKRGFVAAAMHSVLPHDVFKESKGILRRKRTASGDSLELAVGGGQSPLEGGSPPLGSATQDTAAAPSAELP